MPARRLEPVVATSIPQAIRFINAGVQKMEALLAGLLRYSSLGGVALQICPLNVNGILTELLAAICFQLDETGAEVNVDPLPVCRGDHAQTSQVFANLLDNALKYRRPDPPPRINVTSRVVDGRALYAVADNGISIATKHQAKVFEVFHRLDPDATPGEGLGLAIAQLLLERQKAGFGLRAPTARGPFSTFRCPRPKTRKTRHAPPPHLPHRR